MADKSKAVKQVEGVEGFLSKLKLPICIGTWAWGGNVKTFGDDAKDIVSQQAAFNRACELGCNFFDTAEMYSDGESEKCVGKFAKEYWEEKKTTPEQDPILMATKFIPTPFRIRQCNLEVALKASLGRLGVKKCDLYQVHGPAFSIRKVEVWAEGLAEAHKAGLVSAVGVSNYNSDQIKRTHATLAKHGIQLESNQIEYSLLHRMPEDTGLIKTCEDLGVKILAYSPLAMGRLTGKYSAENPPAGNRKFGETDWAKIDKLMVVMKQVAEAHSSEEFKVTPAQVALAWCIKKGVIPICGAKSVTQVEDNLAAAKWNMRDEEMKSLDAASVTGVTSFWQGSST